MIQYPEGLPCFQRSGYGFELADPQVRSELESGRARVRPGFTAGPTRIPCVALMNDMQATLFMAWWDETLNFGTEYFEVMLKSPMGFAKHVARFAGRYDGPFLVEGSVSMWRISCVLDLRKRPVLPPGWAAGAPEFILHMGRFDILMNRTWPEAIDGNTP